jgi:hypothetical protein
VVKGFSFTFYSRIMKLVSDNVVLYFRAPLKALIERADFEQRQQLSRQLEELVPFTEKTKG